MYWRWLQRLLQRLQRRQRGGAGILIPDHELVPELSRHRDLGGPTMRGKKPIDQVVFEGARVILNTLEGGPGGRTEFQGETGIEDFAAEWFRRCRAQGAITYGLAPPGIVVRTIWHRNGIVVFLIEVAPGPRTMQWLRDDSPAAFGPSAKYRDVHISLPWQYFFIAMHASGQLASGSSSVYFLNVQLRSTDQELADCHFFNCSVDAHQLHCWICSQYFPGKEEDQSLAEYAASIIDRFYSGGFNQSSEHHEGASFWGRNRTRIKDPRVRTIDAWEKATRTDARFALTVPWLSSGLTAHCVFEQLTGNAPVWFPRSTKDVANVVTACIDQRKGG